MYGKNDTEARNSTHYEGSDLVSHVLPHCVL